MTPEPAQPAESPEARAIVPVEPTEDMIDAGAKAYNAVPGWEHEAALDAIRCWSAMLAASTARPTERGAVDKRREVNTILSRLLQKLQPQCTDLSERIIKGNKACAEIIAEFALPATDQAAEVEERSKLVARLGVEHCYLAPSDVAEARRLIALATQPATGRTMGGEVFDQRPQCTTANFGPEPSLRQMVRFYYGQHGQPDPDGDTEQYFAALQKGGE